MTMSIHYRLSLATVDDFEFYYNLDHFQINFQRWNKHLKRTT